MGKFLKNILYFLIFIGVTYPLFLFSWGHLSLLQVDESNLKDAKGGYGHLYTRIREITKFKNVDVLFLGSSHAYRGFDTRIFNDSGYVSFNLGSSAQTPLQTNILLKQYLKSLNPKLVIYEIYPSTFTGDGEESFIDLISNDYIDFNYIKPVFEVNHIKVYNTIIYTLMNRLLGVGATFEESKIKDKDVYVSGGYVEKEVSYYKYAKKGKSNLKLLKNQQRYFEKNLQLIKDNGSEVILVYAPVTKPTYNAMINLPEYFDYVNERGVFFDFNTIIDLDDSLHFYDSHHLNQNGVELFNKKLIEVIESVNF